MVLSSESFYDSLWHATSREPTLAAEVMNGPPNVDVAVIGGGYCGLSAALHLAEAGAKVVLFEAETVGYGGSGRNGGQVIPGIKYALDYIERKLGVEQGRAFVDFVGSTAETVFDLVERHGIDCSPVRKGWIQAAHSPRALGTVLQKADEWASRGVPVERFDASGIRDILGAEGYCGGWRDPRAGTVHPLALARGMARASRAAGATILQNSPVNSLRRQGKGWEISSGPLRVNARRVVVTTNAYSGDLLPQLKQSYLTVQSMLLATEPLDEALLATLMKGGVCASETRKIAVHFRRSPDNRLVFGGRGAIGAEQKAIYLRALELRMRKSFPQLAEAPIAFSWSGQVALTWDGVPHLHEPEEGMTLVGGYNGRGVAMATSMGKVIAATITRGVANPYPVSMLRALPFYHVRKPALQIGIAYYWVKDRLGFAS